MNNFKWHTMQREKWPIPSNTLKSSDWLHEIDINLCNFFLNYSFSTVVSLHSYLRISTAGKHKGIKELNTFKPRKKLQYLPQYCCESDIAVYAWGVTWNYFYQIFYMYNFSLNALCIRIRVADHGKKIIPQPLNSSWKRKKLLPVLGFSNNVVFPVFVLFYILFYKMKNWNPSLFQNLFLLKNSFWNCQIL